ncbi:transcription factor Adf-1 [Lucilia sericata]|uniref:transcription factor Adf-1 n=1 Tax=Lucilia sericata TaxID=13632 RepID=UPI0018A808F0|nr:transcription factor Adf-1 [Lucilia sericata]
MTSNHRPLEEGDIELIDRVRASPCLYNTKDPNFRLIYKKEQEWQAVADGLAMTHWEARKRWTVLRDRYARELKQLILHPDSTEYGKNDFFLRMDFIRNYVKKREVKRKRDKARPVKLYKVESDGSNYETDYNQMSQTEKSYIIDDSQDGSSTGKYSYVEQLSQDHMEVAPEHQHANEIQEEEPDEHCGEQEYHDYVEDTSAVYEAVEEDPENLTHTETDANYLLAPSVSRSVAAGGDSNVIVKPECNNIVDGYNISMQEEQLCSAPAPPPPLVHSHQKTVIQNTSRDTNSPNLPPDTEEYFSKTIASYLRQLSPRHKIKAKVEMMQIIEKFIELEETKS